MTPLAILTCDEVRAAEQLAVSAGISLFALMQKAGQACADVLHLDRDREFLTRGGVLTNDVLDAYIGLKMQEVTRFRMSTHPIEMELYYSC